MATIKFQILSKSENASIYLRLSIKRELNIRTHKNKKFNYINKNMLKFLYRGKL